MNWNPFQSSLFTGAGIPIGLGGTQAPPPPALTNQVKQKLAIDSPESEAQWLENQASRYFEGYDANPEAYAGKPTGEMTRTRGQDIARRSSEAASSRNARLGKQGAMQGADATRLGLDAQAQLEGAQADNQARGAFESYMSKVAERDASFDKRQGMAQDGLKRAMERAQAMRQGAPGVIAGGLESAAGGPVGLAIWGASKGADSIAQANPESNFMKGLQSTRRKMKGDWS